ncbi:pectate lyase [Flaviaesturariibacter amylovorans]|uniref:Pectate lyase n=1 Tax=Flaviaesturariibacter amylovorans TaxID=1084520 RepID=A0ABP8GCM4_9BACT
MYGRQLLIAGCLLLSAPAVRAQDAVADAMLLYQRTVGGWPKHINEVKVDYTQPLTEVQRAALLDDKGRNDATIDNNATTREIRYLLKAHATHRTPAYLKAAERGICYLLQMQYPNGGFPQFWPDTSGYRKMITYNDNAMVNALLVLHDVGMVRPGFEAVNGKLKRQAQLAVNRGIDCILKTQIRVGGKLTGWCAQHDRITFAPVKARAFELVSLSGAETVGIVEFLMRMEQPTPEVKNAVNSAVAWLQAVRIDGFAYGDTLSAEFPKGRDRLLRPEPGSAVWARFYDIETGKPFFAGRDGMKRWDLTEIEHERRTGYAWYGTWAQKLLTKNYPAWRQKHEQP